MLFGLYYAGLRTTSTGSELYHSGTIEMALEDVFASTAISALSTGASSGVSGWGSSYIKQYSRRKPDGTYEFVTHPTAVVINMLYVKQCAFIEFRVAAVKADVVGQMTVLILSPGSSDEQKQMRKLEGIDFIYQKETLASHTFSLLEKGSRVPLDDLINQARRDVAEERRLNPDLIEVVHRKPDPDAIKFVPLDG